MGLWPLELFKFFQRGQRLYTSESDVYRRHILTYKDGPRAESVNRLSRLYSLFTFFYHHITYQFFKHVDFKMWHQSANFKKLLTSILLNLNNFHSLEVVSRVSEAQI